MWWSYYLFSVAAGAGWLNWTILGAGVLTLLFQGSTTLTERISVRKYPAYAEYQKTTSRLIPWFPRYAALSACSVRSVETVDVNAALTHRQLMNSCVSGDLGIHDAEPRVGG